MKEQDESAFQVLNAGAIRPIAPDGDGNENARGESTTRWPAAVDVPTTILFALVCLAALVAAPLFGYVYGYTWLDWALFGVLYVVTGLGITVGYHRLIAHGSFQCPDWVKAALLVAGGWAMENSALKWSADHALHHVRVDQDDDPYNAKKGFWYSHCGWVLRKNRYYTEAYAPWLRNDGVVLWQHRWYVPIVLSGLALPFAIGSLQGGGVRGLGCFLLAGMARVFLVLNSTFCINSVCHLWGTQPYNQANSSRDSWWVSLMTFGEGYHNYHHSFPRDYRNGPKWYNIDPSKWLIFVLAKVSLASELLRSEKGTASASVARIIHEGP